MAVEKSFQYSRGPGAQPNGHGSRLLSMSDFAAREAQVLMHGALHVRVIVKSQGFPEVRPSL